MEEGAIYVETSALGRVLLGEPDSPAILKALGRFPARVASRLLRVELRRLALRRGLLEQAGEVLGGIALVPLDDAVLRRTETIVPTGVATLDALHLATAVGLVEAGLLRSMMTYDVRLARGCEHHGIEVIAPA